jgi:hypothetical protein
MYENQSNFEKALLLFCNRVDIICAMEMSNKIDADSAYKNIKSELKELKRIRKQLKKDADL